MGDDAGLQIDDDMVFQERAWHVERIAWVTILVIVVLALLGVFGTGPLSSAVAGSQEQGLVLDYERFVRHNGEASLEIELGPGHVSGGHVELWLSTDYLKSIRIESISPEPDEIRGEGDRQVYVFLTGTPDAPMGITFNLRPDIFGRLSGEMGIVNGPSVSFDQFSYP